MTLAAQTYAVERGLRSKELDIAVTQTGNYTATTTPLPDSSFVQPAAGDPLTFSVIVGDTLSGNLTLTTAGGTGGGNQIVNMATYSNLASATPSLATAAAVALAAALTAGALGVASGSTYTGSVAGGVVTLTTNKPAEVLSATASTVVQTNPNGGGDNLNLSALTAAPGLSDAVIGYPGVITDYSVEQAPPGYIAILIPGSTLQNWLLQFWETGSATSGPLAELASGAYPAAILNNPTRIKVRGPKMRI